MRSGTTPVWFGFTIQTTVLGCIETLAAWAGDDFYRMTTHEVTDEICTRYSTTFDIYEYDDIHRIVKGWRADGVFLQ